MSVTKDGKTGKWMSQIRVTDWTGNVIHKKKRGFATRRVVLEWEHNFIMQASGSIGMTFADFIPSLPAGSKQLRGSPKFRLLCKPPFA